MSHIERRSRKFKLQTSKRKTGIRPTPPDPSQQIHRVLDRWRKEADRQYFRWQRTRTVELFRTRRLEREAQHTAQDNQREE